MTFLEFCHEVDMLKEGSLPTGAVIVYASRSKTSGNEAVRAYRRGRSALRRGQGRGSALDRTKRLEAALDASLEGQIHTRHQIGNLVAVVVASNLTKRRGRNRR